MKTVIILSVVVAVFSRPDSQYTDRYDSVNVPEVLANDRVLVPYIKCLLEEIKCSPEGKELKSHIKEALENNCAKCTAAQQDGTRLVIGHLINHKPDYWKQLSAKYDRDGKYVAKYEADLKTLH